MPSKKILMQKQQHVKETVEKYKDAKTIILVDYLGLTVEEDTQFRADMREKEVDYKVLKNRMLKLAFKEMGIEGIDPFLQGPTALAMSLSDYVIPASVCANEEKTRKVFEIKCGIMDGKVITADEVRDLAKMPSREELLASTLRGLNAPISGFVNVLAANMRGLVTVLKAISEKAE